MKWIYITLEAVGAILGAWVAVIAVGVFVVWFFSSILA